MKRSTREQTGTEPIHFIFTIKSQGTIIILLTMKRLQKSITKVHFQVLRERLFYKSVNTFERTLKDVMGSGSLSLFHGLRKSSELY